MAWTTPRTWVTDELVTASQFNEQVRDNLSYLKGRTDAADAGRQTLTALTEFSTNIASITISSIPAGYGVLHIMAALRSDRAGDNKDDIAVQINGDSTAANYTSGRIQFVSTSIAGSLTSGVGYILATASATAATATASNVGWLHLQIPHYASTAIMKTIAGWYSTQKSFAAGQLNGVWDSTQAIASVQLTPVNGANFTLGAYSAWLTN